MTRFVHLSDLHISHPDAGDQSLHADTISQLRHAVTAIGRLQPAPDFVVCSGDITNLGDEASFRLAHDLLAPLTMPVVIAMGNHDKRAGYHQVWGTGLGDAPVCTDQVLAGVHVITLDTMQPGKVGGAITDDQFAFLEQALARHQDLPRLIVAHHPPRTAPHELTWEVLVPDSAKRLAHMLRGQNVIGILSGHVHMNAVRMWHGIPIYLSNGLNTTIDLLEPEDMRILAGTGMTLFDLRDCGLSATFIPLTPTQTEVGFIPASRLRAFS